MTDPPQQTARIDWPATGVFAITWLLCLLCFVFALLLELIERPDEGYLVLVSLGLFGTAFSFSNTLVVYLTFSRTWPPLRGAVVVGAYLVSLVGALAMLDRTWTLIAMMQQAVNFSCMVLLHLLPCWGLVWLGRVVWKWRLQTRDQLEPPPRLAIWHLLTATALVAVCIAALQMWVASRNPLPTISTYDETIRWHILLPAFACAICQATGLWTILRLKSLPLALFLALAPPVVLVSGVDLYVLLHTTRRFIWEPTVIAGMLTAFVAGYTFGAYLPLLLLRLLGRRLVAGESPTSSKRLVPEERRTGGGGVGPPDEAKVGV